MLSLFLDFEKAFNTVQHDLLVFKLEEYGIRGITLDLIRSYLHHCQQYVHVNNISSNKLRHDIPQGSILGPLFFLIYMT